MKIAATTLLQVAFVVEDLGTAITQWSSAAGIGPFFVAHQLPFEDLTFKDSPFEMDMSMAVASTGSIQIELIQPHSTWNSPFREQGRILTGQHHLGQLTDDYEATIRSCLETGASKSMEGRFGDMRFCYFDTRATIGCFTEILENSPFVRDLNMRLKLAAAEWDGQNPVRNF